MYIYVKLEPIDKKKLKLFLLFPIPLFFYDCLVTITKLLFKIKSTLLQLPALPKEVFWIYNYPNF